jgi:membrane fusion protein, multidrug efflux system
MTPRIRPIGPTEPLGNERKVASGPLAPRQRGQGEGTTPRGSSSCPSPRRARKRDQDRRFAHSRQLLLLLAGLCLAPACRRQENIAGAGAGRGAGVRRPLKFPVEVEKVEARAFEYAVSAVGSVEAFETVQVTARVQGVVERVRFAEGERVAPRRVLAEIEPQRHRLAVDSTRAALEKTKAALADARAGLERREKAVAGTPGLIPGEEIETWRTRLRTAEADLAEKQAALAKAELDLKDAYVRAPLGGVIETRLVETGQYVQPGTVLATLVRREPLLLRFNVPAPEAVRLRPGLKARFQIREDPRPREALLSHVGHAADPKSRMVTVTAKILDEDRGTLRPGDFAEVSVPVGAPRDTPALLQTAVRPTERGFVAFVVEEGTARERILTLGLRTPDGRVEIRSGVKVGELVVVRGAEALREGASVEVERPAGNADRPADARGLHP